MTTVPNIVRRLQDSLLGSEVGVPEETYNILHELVGAVLGGAEADALNESVDATDGYYYYPEGNLVEPPSHFEPASGVASRDLGSYFSGGADVATMNDLLDALDNRIEDDEEDTEPEVELYDDLAD